MTNITNKCNMTDSLAASSSRSKRRKGARSVSGCLTCRRRRVKCAVQRTPCDNCQRLTLTCTPSFHMNFKNWTPITGPSSAVDVPISASPEGAIPHDSSSRRKSGVTDAGQGNSAEVEEFPQGVILWLSSGLENGEFDLNHPSQTSTPSSASLGTHPRLNLEEPVLDNWTFQPLSGTITTTHLASPSSNSVIPGFSGGAFDRLEVQDESALASSSSFDFNMLGISTQMPQVYGNWDGEVPFLNGYEINMPKLLTSKSSPWNPYNYMLDSTRGNPDSPLRHGILSWTCSYLSCREQNSEYSGAVYYVSASSAAQNIISELTAEAKPGCLIGGNARRSEKLYMLLSTAFFLSHCDMMLCDYQSLYTRLDSIKELFEQHWHELKPSLSSLDCRLLTWLAYIDIRSSLFGNQKFRRIESSKQQRDLLSILVDLNALPFLRFVAEGRSYLSDCYGESYPKSELEEDLLQEPCHMKCDDVLSIFSTLNAFETWIAEYPRDESVNSVIEELRTAKIQALRANISRIRAVSAQTPKKYKRNSHIINRSVRFSFIRHTQAEKTLSTAQPFTH